MSAEIVNLRRARKRSKRAADDAQADQNRVTYGLTKAQRAQALQETDAQTRILDGARRERNTAGDPPDA